MNDRYIERDAYRDPMDEDGSEPLGLEFYGTVLGAIVAVLLYVFRVELQPVWQWVDGL